MKLCTQAGELCLKANIFLPVEHFMVLGETQLRVIRHTLSELQAVTKTLAQQQAALFGSDGCSASIYLPFPSLNSNAWLLGTAFFLKVFVGPLQGAYGTWETPDVWQGAGLVMALLASRDAARAYWQAVQLRNTLLQRNALLTDITSLTQKGATASGACHACPVQWPGQLFAYIHMQLHDPGWDETMGFLVGSVDVATARALRRLEAKEKPRS